MSKSFDYELLAPFYPNDDRAAVMTANEGRGNRILAAKTRSS